MKQTNLEDIDAFFQKLCEENYTDLGNFLLVLTKDREQAQDILQETFIVAWQKRQKLISHPNPAGFLFQTARICQFLLLKIHDLILYPGAFSAGGFQANPRSLK